MIIKVNSYSFFNKKKIGSVYNLQRKFGVKHNSYAGKAVSRLYFQYFGNAYDIRKIYKKYYRKEFPSCEDFLVCRYNIDEALAREIVKKNMYCVDMELKRDQISYTFEQDEELVNLFKKYVGGIRSES